MIKTTHSKLYAIFYKVCLLLILLTVASCNSRPKTMPVQPAAPVQSPAKLVITRIEVSPTSPQSAKCCFTIRVWVKNTGSVASGQHNMWVYVEQPPKPEYITKDHGAGQPILIDGILANQELLVYNRNDWVVNFPQGYNVKVEIEGQDTKLHHFDAR